MNLQFETNFVVYPRHANCMSPMIFGGAFFSELDLAAAMCVHRLLYDSATCETAVTHKFEGTFHKPCYLGDLIFLKAEIISLGKKSVVVEVRAYREKGPERELVADAKFVFVTITAKGPENAPLPYQPHGLTMPQTVA